MHIAAELLKEISGILSRAANGHDAIHEVAELVGRVTQADQVRISLVNPRRSSSIEASFDSGNDQEPVASLSRELRSGMFLYGSLELSASRSALRAVELFQFFNTLEAMLLSFAVLESRRSDARWLKARLTLMKEDLHQRKWAARMDALLAREIPVSMEAA